MDVGTVASNCVEKCNVRKSYRNPGECSVFQQIFLLIHKVTELINDDLVDHNNKVIIYVVSHPALNFIGSLESALS